MIRRRLRLTRTKTDLGSIEGFDGREKLIRGRFRDKGFDGMNMIEGFDGMKGKKALNEI